jgi:hypothetical protein
MTVTDCPSVLLYLVGDRGVGHHAGRAEVPGVMALAEAAQKATQKDSRQLATAGGVIPHGVNGNGGQRHDRRRLSLTADQLRATLRPWNHCAH